MEAMVNFDNYIYLLPVSYWPALNIRKQSSLDRDRTLCGKQTFTYDL